MSQGVVGQVKKDTVNPSAYSQAPYPPAPNESHNIGIASKRNGCLVTELGSPNGLLAFDVKQNLR